MVETTCSGGFDTEKEAALAYDIACVRFRGGNAQTNFDIAGYAFEMEHLEEVFVLPITQSCIIRPALAAPCPMPRIIVPS